MTDQTPSQRVAENVRAALARKRVSTAGLARGLGRSYTPMHRRVAGLQPFDLDEIHEVATFLNVPFSELIEGVAAQPGARQAAAS